MSQREASWNMGRSWPDLQAQILFSSPSLIISYILCWTLYNLRLQSFPPWLNKPIRNSLNSMKLLINVRVRFPNFRSNLMPKNIFISQNTLSQFRYQINSGFQISGFPFLMRQGSIGNFGEYFILGEVVFGRKKLSCVRVVELRINKVKKRFVGEHGAPGRYRF